MAGKKETVQEVKAAEAVQEVKDPAAGAAERKEAVREPVYRAEEFAANAQSIFKTGQECVTAALKTAGKTECTLAEARKIVEAFLKKEVK